MTGAECDWKIALVRASWRVFDDVAARVSPELRKGPRGGGRDQDQIIRYVNGAEIDEFAPKVGVRVPLETRGDAEALRAYRGDYRDRREPLIRFEHDIQLHTGIEYHPFESAYDLLIRWFQRPRSVLTFGNLSHDQ